MVTKYLVMVFLASIAAAASAKNAVPLELKTPKDKVSYASGVASIRNFSKSGIDVSVDVMIQAIRDAAEGKKLAMDEKEIASVLQGLQVEIRRNQAANHQELAGKNRKRSEEFLAEFRKKDGVQALPNGVLYKIVKSGEGRKPVETDMVEVKYRGTKLDGTEFDATSADKPATLRMNQTIMGWREALKNMPTGSRWQVVIPYLLAYGERGVGEVIGPNETLMFDVELVGIK